MMMTASRYIVFPLLLVALTLPGCAHAKRDTGGFAMEDTITVNKNVDETWQATKSVLRELDLEIYTRDKRGEFVAFTEMERYLKVFTPRRTQLSIKLEPVTANSTKVTIETLQQVYGVTMLTYPDWHDRKTSDNKEAQSIIEALRAKVG